LSILGIVIRRQDASQQIIINLPVKDLDKSKTHFSALGDSFNPQFSNESVAIMVIADGSIHAILMTEGFFKTLIDKPLVQAKEANEVVLCLSCESREEVDRLIANAGTYCPWSPTPPLGSQTPMPSIISCPLNLTNGYATTTENARQASMTRIGFLRKLIFLLAWITTVTSAAGTPRLWEGAWNKVRVEPERSVHPMFRWPSCSAVRRDLEADSQDRPGSALGNLAKHRDRPASHAASSS
jgi:predicted lactoylglutathione lyase